MRFLFIILTCQCYASPADYDAARSNAISAAYKQSGFESLVTQYAKDLDQKYVPAYVNDNGIVAMVLFKCIEKHELSWKWSF